MFSGSDKSGLQAGWFSTNTLLLQQQGRCGFSEKHIIKMAPYAFINVQEQQRFSVSVTMFIISFKIVT